MKSTDVANAIFELIGNFHRHGMRPPEAVILSTHEDGVLLYGRLSVRWGWNQNNTERDPDKLPTYQTPKGGYRYHEVLVHGVKVRWPTKTV